MLMGVYGFYYRPGEQPSLCIIRNTAELMRITCRNKAQSIDTSPSITGCSPMTIELRVYSKYSEYQR